MVEALQRGASYEALICCAGFLLGEYGRLISGEVPLTEQFGLLHSRFIAASPETKALLLSTYLKFGVSEPQNGQLKQLIGDVFNRSVHVLGRNVGQNLLKPLGRWRDVGQVRAYGGQDIFPLVREYPHRKRCI